MTVKLKIEDALNLAAAAQWVLRSLFYSTTLVSPATIGATKHVTPPFPNVLLLTVYTDDFRAAQTLKFDLTRLPIK